MVTSLTLHWHRSGPTWIWAFTVRPSSPIGRSNATTTFVTTAGIPCARTAYSSAPLEFTSKCVSIVYPVYVPEAGVHEYRFPKESLAAFASLSYARGYCTVNVTTGLPVKERAPPNAGPVNVRRVPMMLQVALWFSRSWTEPTQCTVVVRFCQRKELLDSDTTDQ